MPEAQRQGVRRGARRDHGYGDLAPENVAKACFRALRVRISAVGHDIAHVARNHDVSSAWTQLAFEGAKVVEPLRKGCAVDLHPHMFPAGACCVTGFAKMRVVLWRSSTEDRYDMLVGRSYALSLWSWLLEAAAPYGGQQTKELSQ